MHTPTFHLDGGAAKLRVLKLPSQLSANGDQTYARLNRCKTAPLFNGAFRARMIDGERDD